MRASYQEIDWFGPEAIATLIAEWQGPCVSLYLPMAGNGGGEPHAAGLQLKPLLEQAEERLFSEGMRPAEVQELLAPATQLIESNAQFWQNQSGGLAFFLTRNHALSYRLPLPLPEQLVVDHRFYIRPLVPLLSGDGAFYILALSQNQVRLLRASRSSVGEVKLEKIPHSLAEATRYDHVEPMREVHSIASSGIGGGRRAVAFHGQGTAADEKLVKESIHQFLQQVEGEVTAQVAGQQAPLILAGVDYLCHMYRQVNHYRNLQADSVEGNPDRASAAELQAQAWPIAAPIFQEPRRTALARYAQWAGQTSGQAIHQMPALVSAAYAGRVDTLFVATADQVWGTFDPATGVAEIHPNRQAADEELLNFAVVQTLQNRGLVYSAEPQELSDNAPVAALLRY